MTAPAPPAPAPAASATLDGPITLISHGRSGTSVVMNAFAAHPEVLAVGETASLIFATWYGMERSKGIVRPDPAANDHDHRCAKAVRAVMATAFPEIVDRPWMQKPINAPWIMQNFPKTMDDTARGAWYWRVMSHSFPAARYLTMLRHPYDVVLSAEAHWGASQRWTFRMLGEMARILTHPDSRVDFALSHARLVADPGAALRALFHRFDLIPHPECLAVANTAHVPAARAKETGAAATARRYSRRQAWDRIDPSLLTDGDRAALRALWSRFDEPLDL